MHWCNGAPRPNSLDARGREHGVSQVPGQLSDSLTPLSFFSSWVPDPCLQVDTQSSRNGSQLLRVEMPATSQGQNGLSDFTRQIRVLLSESSQRCKI